MKFVEKQEFFFENIWTWWMC